MTGLELDTRYYYQVGVPDNGTSDVMSFQTKDGNLVFAVSKLTVFHRDVTHASARHTSVSRKIQEVLKKMCSFVVIKGK